MTSTTRRAGVVAALTTAALAAAPAAATAAPTLAVDRGCYTPDMPIRLSGAGWTPGGPLSVSLAIGNAFHGYSGNALPTGQIGGAIPLPAFDGDMQLDATVTAVDRSLVPPGQPPAPDQMATAAFKASQWAMMVPGWGDGSTVGTGRPGRTTPVEAVGFVGTASTTLFAHYLRGGRLVKTSRIGALSGPCADLDTRFRQFPFKTKPGATYRVIFDTTRAWPNDDAGIVYRRVKVRGEASRAIRLLQGAAPDRAIGHR